MPQWGPRKSLLLLRGTGSETESNSGPDYGETKGLGYSRITFVRERVFDCRETKVFRVSPRCPGGISVVVERRSVPTLNGTRVKISPRFFEVLVLFLIKLRCKKFLVLLTFLRALLVL